MYRTIVVVVIYNIIAQSIPEPQSPAVPVGRGWRTRHSEVVVVVLPGLWLCGWWWLSSRRVPRIQPRIDRGTRRLVTVHRVPVLVHRIGTAHRGQRHLLGRLQVLLGPVELGTGEVRACRSGPTATVATLRQILLGTVQGVLGIAGTIKVRARGFCKAPTVKRLRRVADLVHRQVLQGLRDELQFGTGLGLLFPGREILSKGSLYCG